MSSLSLDLIVDAPVLVAEFDVDEPHSVRLPGRPGAFEARQPEEVLGKVALVLVRIHGKPVGTILVEMESGRLEPSSVAAKASSCLADEIAANIRQLPESPVAAEPITIVVATRERPHLLLGCLESLTALNYPNYDVVVVDNAPLTDDTLKMVRSHSDARIRYVRENRQGLAAAHNAGLAAATGTIVAFTDDDVVVDENWLEQIARAMRSARGVACVTGLIMPAELDTTAQLMLELHGDFAKGFEPRIFDTTAHRPPDALFPFTVGRLGSGANMAFDRQVLHRIGGFDSVIGTGTIARGGDDLAALFDVLIAGHSIAYEPGALVWHRHKRDEVSLAAQAYGYGVGLTAYLTSVMVRHPLVVGQALRRMPVGLAYALQSTARRDEQGVGTWPRNLTKLERRGMVVGPFAYAASRWRNRGVARARTNGGGK